MTSTFLKGIKEIKDSESIQSSFLYDRSSIIKKTFVSEVNEFLHIMCSFGYFGKTTDIQEINLISPKNSSDFLYRKKML